MLSMVVRNFSAFLNNSCSRKKIVKFFFCYSAVLYGPQSHPGPWSASDRPTALSGSKILWGDIFSTKNSTFWAFFF